jgi:hypothetical protein
MISGISTKDLQKARRNAERKRASVACARCKAGKTKCSDYRPCKKCKSSNVADGCVTGEISFPFPWLSSVSSDANSHAWSMESTSRLMEARFLTSRTAFDFHIHQESALKKFSNSRSLTSRPKAEGSNRDFSIAGAAEKLNTAIHSNEPDDLLHEASQSDLPKLGTNISKFNSLLSNSVQAASTQALQSVDSGFLPTIHSYPGPNCFQTQRQNTRDPSHGSTWTYPPIFPSPFPLLLMQQRFFLPPVAALAIGSAEAAAPRLTAPSIDASLLLALRDRLQTTGAAPHSHRLAPPPPNLPLPPPSLLGGTVTG